MPVTDQGFHEFNVWLSTSGEADVARAAHRRDELLAPPLTWDLTG